MQFISPLSWPGGKSKYINNVLKYFPKKIVNYVEPFCGGASIGLRLLYDKRVENQVIFNDINKDLINFWLDVKNNNIIDNYPDLTNLNEAKNIYTSIPKTNKKSWEFLLINRLSFSGMERAGFSKTRFNLKYYSCLERVKLCEKLLNNALLFNEDYKKMIKEFDSENTLFYFDPPYHDVSKNIYVYEEMNFVELRNNLKKIKGRFILSLNDHPFINELFKDFYVFKESWKYSMTNGTKKRKNEIGKELVIMNFELDKPEQISLFE